LDNPQDSKSSICPATEDEVNDCNERKGKAISVKDTKKYFSHESHERDSESDTPCFYLCVTICGRNTLLEAQSAIDEGQSTYSTFECSSRMGMRIK